MFAGGPLPEVLQETQVLIQDNRDCSHVYQRLSKKIFHQGIPSDSLICTGGGQKKDTQITDACQVNKESLMALINPTCITI